MSAAGSIGRVGLLRLVCAALVLLAMGRAPAASGGSAGPNGPAAASADTIYALTSSGVVLLRFGADKPGVISATVAITGLESGVELKAIDFRPATGQLYGLGLHLPSMSGWLYVINPLSGAASRIGTTTFYSPLLNNRDYDIDFNPGADRVRMINSDGLNLRINPGSGVLSGHDNNLHNSISLTTSQQYASVAYAPAKTGFSASSAYVYEYLTDSLFMLGGPDGTPSANSGLLSKIGPVGVASATEAIGLDISSGGQAYASIQTGGGSGPYGLYTVNLANGAVSLVGNIGTGSTAIMDIAVVPRYRLHLPLARK